MADYSFEENFTPEHHDNLIKGEYEACQFHQIDWSESDLKEYKFIDCSFEECNLSNTLLQKTSFQDCKFNKCKLLGIRFEDCNPFNFSIHIHNSNLDHSSFYQVKLSNSQFFNTSMQGVELTEADLSNSKISECNLLDAQFENTNLQNCDLSRSRDLELDPEINQLKGAIFSEDQLIGLLRKYGIRIQ